MASTYGIVGRVGVLVEPTFKNTQKKVREGLGKPIAQEAPRQGRNVGDMIVSGTTRAFQVGGLAAGAALGAAITKGFGRLRAMEDATTKIEGLGYAASEVEQIMTDVRGALDGTMFLYSEGANVAAGALAAGVEQGEELEAYLRLTADAATQAGIDFDTMGQMMNKVEGDGRLMGDTIQQLTENGIYVLPALAEEFGVTGEEMRKMVSNGEVDAETFRRIMTDQFGGSSEKAADTMTGAMSLAWTAVGQLGERLISEVYPYLKEFFQGFYEWVQDISPKVEEFGKAVGEAIGNIIEWITENPGAVKAFAAAIGAVFAAMAAYTIVTKVQNAFKALNLVMSMNPVGLWVAAIAALIVGLIWAWNNVDWFRDAVLVAWDWITTAFTWAWENVISPVIDWIVDAWNWLVDVIVKAWENDWSPVWDAIQNAAKWLWEKALKPVFDWIGDKWDDMILGMKMYWEKVLKPVWNIISTVAMWLWNTVLKPIFTFIGNHWDKILTAMKWAWDHILKPAWDAIVNVVTWLWETILSPIFTWIGNKWDDILRGMKIVWENILKPAFEKLGETVTGLKDKFDTAVDNIKKAWDKIKSIAAQPIKFVIEKVLNDGLISGFNKLVDWIPGVNGLKKIPLPGWMDGYHAGGWTGPGSKYQPAGIVHADEFVINKESRRRFEHLHPGLLTHINRHGDLAGYASGGLVQPVRGRFTSGFGASRGRYPHAGVDWAVPVGTPVRAALAGSVARTGWNAVQGRTGIGVLLAHSGNRNTYYGHLSRSHVNVGDQIAKGAILGLSGNTGRSTGPHLHFETWTGGKPIDPMKYMGGLPASEEGGSGWFDPLAPFRAIGDKITSWIEGKFPDGGIIVDAALQGAKGGFDRILDWASSLLGGSGDSGQDKDGGSGSVRQQVQDVAAKYGWSTGAQWNALSEIIQRESSWNLLARNPRSSAAGLFQKMQSAHGPVEGTASGQAEWGLDYISGRYGSPSAALAHHNRRGWYADGGHVKPDHFLFRDRGGNLPPGLSMVLNNTGRDEYIMNQRQAANVMATSPGPQEIIGTLYMENGALAGEVRGVLADPATTRRLSQQMASQSSRDLMGVGARAR